MQQQAAMKEIKVDSPLSDAETALYGAGDIAIVGYSFKLPRDVDDDSSLWEVLHGRRNLMTPWPDSRMSAGSFINNTDYKVGVPQVWQPI